MLEGSIESLIAVRNNHSNTEASQNTEAFQSNKKYYNFAIKVFGVVLNYEGHIRMYSHCGVVRECDWHKQAYAMKWNLEFGVTPVKP